MARKPINERKIKAASEKSVKMEIYGEELIEKVVKKSGRVGRVYLPAAWCGENVKIIRTKYSCSL